MVFPFADVVGEASKLYIADVVGEASKLYSTLALPAKLGSFTHYVGTFVAQKHEQHHSGHKAGW